MPPWVYLLGAVGTIAGTLATAFVLLAKYGPEVNKIQIETSESLVSMAKANADMHKTDADDLRERNRILDDRLTKYVEKLGQALHRIEDLESRTAEVDSLRQEVATLTEKWEAERQAKERIAAENAALRDRVAKLELELAQLKGGPTPD